MWTHIIYQFKLTFQSDEKAMLFRLNMNIYCMKIISGDEIIILWFRERLSYLDNFLLCFYDYLWLTTVHSPVRIVYVLLLQTNPLHKWCFRLEAESVQQDICSASNVRLPFPAQVDVNPSHSDCKQEDFHQKLLKWLLCLLPRVRRRKCQELISIGRERECVGSKWLNPTLNRQEQKDAMVGCSSNRPERTSMC